MVNAAVSKNSRSALYAKKVVYEKRLWTTRAEKKKDVKEPSKSRPQKSYPTDDVRRRKKSVGVGKDYQGSTKLKSGLVPGSIVILVAGRHRGKRVIFLKQLESGLLLVTGPFKINGVPLRRVNQKYVLATSTKLELPAINLPERVNDDYFRRVELKANEGGDSEIFASKKAVYSASAERKADQKEVDASILAAAKKIPHMVNYLGANFCLRNGQAPHNMVF